MDGTLAAFLWTGRALVEPGSLDRPVVYGLLIPMSNTSEGAKESGGPIG